MLYLHNSSYQSRLPSNQCSPALLDHHIGGPTGYSLDSSLDGTAESKTMFSLSTQLPAAGLLQVGVRTPDDLRPSHQGNWPAAEGGANAALLPETAPFQGESRDPRDYHIVRPNQEVRDQVEGRQEDKKSRKEQMYLKTPARAVDHRRFPQSTRGSGYNKSLLDRDTRPLLMVEGQEILQNAGCGAVLLRSQAA